MPLLLEPHKTSGDPGRFLVYSGMAVVGTKTEVQSGPQNGWWHRSITGFFVQPKDLGVGAGMAESREGAMQQFAERWRAWLAWAGLYEADQVTPPR